MNIYLPYIIFTAIMAIALFVIRQWLNKLEQKSNVSSELVEWMKDLGQRVDQSTQQVDQKMSQNLEMFNKRLDKAAEVMMHVQKSIGEFSEIGRSMHQLQEFLQSPKLRGNIGEQVLKELLGQCLPQDFYQLQYYFKNGQIVDAIIKTNQGIIPIDSKFPLSSFKKILEEKDEKTKLVLRNDFRKDVKRHIKTISSKYILVSENTVDYALMYIPSESIYYEIINEGDIYDYAAQMKVVPVSPMSFYAYLKVILISFEGQRIQKQAKEILTTLQSMKKDYQSADEALSILNKHIYNAYSQSNNVTRSLDLLGQKIETTASLSSVEQEKLIE